MMMRNIRLLFFTFLGYFLLGNMSICHVLAQEQETEDTHAHSESHKWKGIDVNTVLGNDDYAPNPGQLNTFSPRINKYPFEKGKIIFLYNVGTGMFLIEGGNWGPSLSTSGYISIHH